jgi:DNA-binding CsgD family transcriptional regulator
VHLLEVVASAARELPVVLVLDDVQWLDEASAHCLGYAIRRLGYDSVVVLLGLRDAAGVTSATTSGGAAHPFADVPDFRLGELSRSGAVSQARGLGASLDVARAIVDHCGGLPLAVSQVVSALSPPQRTGAEPLPDPMPASAPEQLFRARILELGEDASAAAAVAAVCDGRAAPALTTVLDSLDAGGALGALEVAGLLTLGASGPSWEHPLARAAAIGAVPAPTLRSIRSSAAEALAALGGHQDTVTWLRRAAAAAPSEALADELEGVALRAERLHSRRAAAEAWEAAAEVGTDSARLGLRLARAARQRFAEGASETGVALSTRALDAGVHGVDLSQLLFDLASVSEGSDPARAVELYEQAADGAMKVGDGRRAIQALAAAVHPSWHTSDVERIDRVVSHLMELHDPADPYQAFLAHASRGFADFGAERPDGQVSLELAIGVCEQDTFIVRNTELLRTVVQVLFWTGQGSRLRAEVLEALDERRRVGDLIGAGKTLYYLAWCDFYAGATESAQILATQAVEVARDAGLSGALVDALTVLSATEGLRGNRELAVALAQEASERATATGVVDQLAEAAWAETFVCLAAGDGKAAAEAAEHLIELILSNRMGRYDPEYFTAAVALAGIGDTSRAVVVRDALAAHVGDAPSAECVVSRALADAAIDGTPLVAARLVVLADDLLQQGRPLWAGRALLGHGSILRRAGERTAARTSLRSAAAIFSQLGALAWIERANDELRACGVKVRSGSSEPLTGAELRVARAVAEGLTNREVASLLFLSPKTVEFHLGRVYQKMGLRSRTELAKAVFSGALGPV